MANQEHKSQRTEQPTAKRLDKAREKGQVARSKEVPAVFVLAAFLIFAEFLGPGWMDRLQRLLVQFLSSPGPADLNITSGAELMRSAVISASVLLALPLSFLLTAGVTGNVIQGRPVLTLEPLKPDFSKINPFKGIKKVFALKQWVELLKGVLKMTLFGAVAYNAVRAVLAESPASSPGIEGVLTTLFSLAGTVILRVTLVAAGLALLDWLFRAYDHTRSLKMSKKEIKDEHKESQGDPIVRARIRQRQMAMARSRMMADVPKATVVVTNPTHYAVALQYKPGEIAAPKVLAKGRAMIAAKIREVAAAHGVPILPDPPLARALYKSVPVGAEIPAALFRAVAEVLALVLRRDRRGARSQRPRQRT